MYKCLTEFSSSTDTQVLLNIKKESVLIRCFTNSFTVPRCVYNTKGSLSVSWSCKVQGSLLMVMDNAVSVCPFLSLVPLQVLSTCLL